MSRFLFVVPPLTGHTNPTVAVGEALRSRGHVVAWTGHAKVIRPLLPVGAHLIPVGDDPDDDDPMLLEAKQRSQGLRGAEALLFLWQDFILPLGRSMVAGVEAAVTQFRPDVMIVDQQAIAGAVVARRRGLPWATSATTSAELVDPFALLPKVGEWVANGLAQFQADNGVPGGGDLRFSEHLVLAFSTEALAGPDRSFPAHYRFVGPSLGSRAAGVDFPWEWLDPSRRLVLVSLGTINAEAGRRFLGEAVAALAGMADRVQAVVVGPPDLVAAVPRYPATCCFGTMSPSWSCSGAPRCRGLPRRPQHGVRDPGPRASPRGGAHPRRPAHRGPASRRRGRRHPGHVRPYPGPGIGRRHHRGPRPAVLPGRGRASAGVCSRRPAGPWRAPPGARGAGGGPPRSTVIVLRSYPIAKRSEMPATKWAGAWVTGPYGSRRASTR